MISRGGVALFLESLEDRSQRAGRGSSAEGDPDGEQTERGGETQTGAAEA